MATALLLLVMVLNVFETYCDRSAVIHSKPADTATWVVLTQAILIVPLLGFLDWLSPTPWLIAVAVAAASTVGKSLWFKALASPDEDLSRLAAVRRLAIPLTAAASVAFLGESVHSKKWLAVVLITLGTMLVTLDADKSRLRIRRLAAVVALTSAVALTAMNVYYKFLLLHGVPILTIFLSLKIAQTAVCFIQAGLTSGISQLSLERPRLFVLARVLQTTSVLVYILALSGVDLSYAVLVTAASPLLYLIVDRLRPVLISRFTDRCRTGSLHTTAIQALRLQPLHVIGLGLIVIGLFVNG